MGDAVALRQWQPNDFANVEDLTGDPMGIHQPFGEEEEDGEPHFD